MDSMKGPPHGVRAIRNSDKVRMIRHQAVGINQHVKHTRRLCEKPKIDTAIFVIAKNVQSPNAALRNVQWDTRNDNPFTMWHRFTENSSRWDKRFGREGKGEGQAFSVYCADMPVHT